jgi:hypothetical protein
MPEHPVIYGFDSGGNALGQAGIVYDAGFSDEEFDYLGIVLLICYAELLHELIGTTLAAASNGGANGVMDRDFCSTVSTARNDTVHSKHTAATALVAIGSGLLVFVVLAQIAC